jgi:hypothetical protein
VYVLATGAPEIVLEEITVGPAVVELNTRSVNIAPALLPFTMNKQPKSLAEADIVVAVVDTAAVYLVLMVVYVLLPESLKNVTYPLL